MANLAEAVDATETDWIISADLDDDIDFLTVEDEIVKVTANFPAQYQLGEGTTSVPRIRVERGAGGTTAASHADTTALTPLIPPSSSAGAGGVTINLTGTETEPGNFFRGDEDPADTPAYLAILEAGDQWTQTGGDLAPPFPVWQRNESNDGWEVAGQIFVDGAGKIRAVNKIQSDGVVILEVRDTDGSTVLGTLRLEPDGSLKLAAGNSEDTQIALLPDGDVTVASAGNVAVSCGPTGFISLLTFGAGLSFGPAADRVELSGLPTVDPAVDNLLWNDAGTLKISLGP